ncbi:beta-galactosidase isoform X2 [Cimex lectularius]|uniref:Beta-galactosidase n=1 Tax=Cimex lectularius TaxID=79782 RepID=A0A8I6SLL8_CIMLE|nr:beta-galactosidase isoform X2 [Cimex lectularius]
MSTDALKGNRTFDIDYDNDVFLKDGKPFTYMSGEIHYFRIPRIYWEDRLKKVQAAGFNAISTYVEWSLHEPSPSVYHFTAEADIVEFIRIAERLGLLVILRPGPYICAERDLGGYPAWLLTVNPKMQFRTSDPSHTFFVSRWFKMLWGQLQPMLYGNGGPVIMVQVENEYGSYPVHDLNYLLWLRDLYRSYVGNAAVLFTTDGPDTQFVNRGKIPGVLSTIDFGPVSTSPAKLFEPLRKIQPKGPLVNSEFYVGWLTYWGEEFSRSSIPPILKTMKDMIALNISFNCYMIHGGTNFGFTSGSGSSKHYQADITSYDYDAPISEAGDLTDKYFAIKDLIAGEKNTSNNKNEEKETPKGDYGEVQLKPLISLLKSPIGRDPVYTLFPITMEAIAERYGFIAYTTTIPYETQDPSVLQVNVRDRAQVLINEVEVSVLQYTVINETPLPSDVTKGKKLTILVENMGRRNYNLLSDCTKGIISNATLDGKLLQNWSIVGYPLTFDNISRLDKYARGSIMSPSVNFPDPSPAFPAFYTGTLNLPEDEPAQDTFLDMTGWGKGVVFINNHNMGRYWHIGPQRTLYIPKIYLLDYPHKNRIMILELHFTAPNQTVRFISKPLLSLKDKYDEPKVLSKSASRSKWSLSSLRSKSQKDVEK